MASCFMQTVSFLYAIIIVLASTASSLDHDEECLALFQFKQTFLHQPSASIDHKFASWRKIPSNTSDQDASDSGCCLWDGVVCSKDGHVIKLNLSNSSLRGPIKSNSTLFNLVHLQLLDLSLNDFVESQIPSEIARLKQLRILNLNGSRFSGQIPSEISHLVKLSSLDLSWNLLKLQSPNLEYLLRNMTRLEELHLSGVDISSSVPRLLANISSLRSIKLRECQLQDEFPSAIFHLPKLTFLNMRNNPRLVGSLPEFHNNTLLEHMILYDTGFGGTIPESIGKLNHLKVLNLGFCSFSGSIPSSFSNLTQLADFSFIENGLTGLVPSLESLSELTSLELSGNKFEKGRMFHWLSKLTKLKGVYVAKTNIHEDIPPSISNLTKLTAVEMMGNSIFGQIPSSFMNLTSLTTLDLSNNQLEGKISSAFSYFKSLKHFELAANKFTGMVDLNMFLGLNKLETLDLSRNKLYVLDTNNYTEGAFPQLEMLGLSSCSLKKFPAFLRYQKKMKYLLLYNNAIEGLVPKWVLNNSLAALNTLDLSNNFITGFHQHPHFLPWDGLEFFIMYNNRLQGSIPIPPLATIVYDVSSNNLSGEIPLLICEVKSLRYLDLSSNRMMGTLPPCFGNLSNSLLVLNLNRNNFHGPMMNTFTYGNPLKRIDMSENQFTGEVSKSLANCTGLQFISLGDNSFDGLFPFWLGNLAELQILILRSNKLHGEIQGCSTSNLNFIKLLILDMSNNSFTGELPDMCFRNWNAMKSSYLGNSSTLGIEFPMIPFSKTSATTTTFEYSMTLINKGVKREFQKILDIFVAIDLSCNDFTGEIPPSLQDLKGIECLNLSNNHLTGRILPSMGNLKNLESLDLSRNELSGEIPRELLQLGYLAILNVSFNHLDGHIPQGKQFDTFDNNSYVGNLGLCGQPLSNDCESAKAATHPPARKHNESILPSERIDWIITLLGVGSGLIVGIVVGNILYARYSDWFDERFGLRNDKWVRPLRNKRRN